MSRKTGPRQAVINGQPWVQTHTIMWWVEGATDDDDAYRDLHDAVMEVEISPTVRHYYGSNGFCVWIDNDTTFEGFMRADGITHDPDGPVLCRPGVPGYIDELRCREAIEGRYERERAEHRVHLDELEAEYGKAKPKPKAKAKAKPKAKSKGTGS